MQPPRPRSLDELLARVDHVARLTEALETAMQDDAMRGGTQAQQHACQSMIDAV